MRDPQKEGSDSGVPSGHSSAAMASKKPSARGRGAYGNGAVRASLIFQVLVPTFLVALVFEGTLGVREALPMPPSTIIGYLLAGFFLLTRVRTFGHLRPAIWCFLVYFVATAILEVVRHQTGDLLGLYDISSFRAYVQFANSLILFIVIQDLFRDPRLARRVGVTFLTVVTLMGVLSLLNVLQRSEFEVFRAGVKGLNLNEQAYLYALAITTIYMLLIDRWARLRKSQAVLGIGTGLLLLVALVRTGSRGGAGALLVGLAAATALSIHRRGSQVLVVVIPTAILAAAAVMQVAGAVLAERVAGSIESGDTGYRLELAEASTMLFWRSPIVGSGAAYVFDLGQEIFGSTERRIAAHNAYLQVLVSFGIAGAVPWFCGLALSLREVWHARKHHWGAVLTVLLFASVVFGLVANLGYNKFFWILLALAARVRVAVPVGAMPRNCRPKIGLQQHTGGMKVPPRHDLPRSARCQPVLKGSSGLTAGI